MRIAASIIGVLLVALISFAGGTKIGARRALFSSQWGQNYERNFLGSGFDTRPRMMGGFRGMMGSWRDWDEKGMRNPHGIGGEIISIASDSLVIKDKNNQENTIRVNEGTIINRGRDTIALTDLKTGDRIVVIGKPVQDGAVVAHLIRVFGQNDNTTQNQQNNTNTQQNNINQNTPNQ